jgi:ribosome-associated protein
MLSFIGYFKVLLPYLERGRYTLAKCNIYRDQMSEFEDDNVGQDQYVSKSQLKQESTERQKLGEAIVALTPANLATIPMDEELEEAIVLARKINRKKDGYRRQLQFIGKLLRSRDVEPLQLALDKLSATHGQANAHFHKLEKLRDSIADDGDDAIQKALEEYPHLSRQTLRQQYRQIQKERQKNAPPKTYRALFQYLKTEIGEE